MKLSCGARSLDLSCPRIMGVLNVTPDSFSDGGKFDHPEKALAHARQMIADGASIIDVGGESTRPGATPVSESEELERVVPVVEKISSELDVIVSVDSSKALVIAEAVAAGAGLVNDVRALQEPAALETVAPLDVAVCLMHMQGQPRDMQDAPGYYDVVRDVGEFLSARVKTCEAAGIGRDRLVIDPGFGFGKTLEHNLQLLAGLGNLCAGGLPVLAGLSRKSMLGMITGRPVEQRVAASVAAALVAVKNGATILRVHDVAETADALKVWLATESLE